MIFTVRHEPGDVISKPKVQDLLVWFMPHSSRAARAALNCLVIWGRVLKHANMIKAVVEGSGSGRLVCLQRAQATGKIIRRD